MTYREDRECSNTWQFVRHDLELKIIKGEYSEGERIPSIRKIARMYDIGTSTAGKILSRLCDDGTIYQKIGVGYFIEPYVREKLIAKHKRKLEKIVLDAFDYADAIGSDIMSMISNVLKIKNKNV